MRTILFEDNKMVGRQIRASLLTILEEAKLAIPVECYFKEWLKSAYEEVQNHTEQVWLIDIGTHELDLRANPNELTEAEQLATWILEYCANSADKQLKHLISDAQQRIPLRHMGGIAIAIVAQEKRIPFRFVSRNSDNLFELCSYLVTGMQRSKPEKWRFTKALYESLVLDAPDVKPEWDRLLSFILDPEAAMLDVPATVEMLAHKLPDLNSRQLRKAYKEIEEMPDVSLNLTRSILEHVLKELFRKYLHKEPEVFMLDQLLSNRDLRKYLPDIIQRRARSIQPLGSSGSHGLGAEATDAEAAFRLLCAILNWYLQ